ncbi:MAG TPA: dTDP-4-dehydrorhamnose 3,5-epimerase [Anaerolineaceae bacterium]
MKFSSTPLKDVLIIEPDLHGDERGFFMETYRADECVQAGITAGFVQDNHSGSRKGILRGLHYQIQQPQGKLVRAIAGEIYDVAVDLRKSSPTCGRWFGTSLSAVNRRQLWIPVGFAHGFYVLSDWAEVVYKATDYYAPQWERSLLWNDPSLSIPWPVEIGGEPQLSGKDRQGKRFSEAELFD